MPNCYLWRPNGPPSIAQLAERSTVVDTWIIEWPPVLSVRGKPGVFAAPPPASQLLCTHPTPARAQNPICYVPLWRERARHDHEVSGAVIALRRAVSRAEDAHVTRVQCAIACVQRKIAEGTTGPSRRITGREGERHPKSPTFKSSLSSSQPHDRSKAVTADATRCSITADAADFAEAGKDTPPTGTSAEFSGRTKSGLEPQIIFARSSGCTASLPRGRGSFDGAPRHHSEYPQPSSKGCVFAHPFW